MENILLDQVLQQVQNKEISIEKARELICVLFDVSQLSELLMAFALYVVNEPTKSIDDLIIDFQKEHCSQ